MVGFVGRNATTFMFELFILLRDGEETGPLAGGWRWSVMRARFVSYIYCFVYINKCIATTVVKRAPVNQWDLGSSPSGTLFSFSHFLTFSDLFVCMRWALWAWLFFLFCWLTPPACLCTSGPFIFIYLFILFFLLNIFSKNTEKILKNIKMIDLCFHII